MNVKSIDSIESIKVTFLNDLGDSESYTFDIPLDCTSWNDQNANNFNSPSVCPTDTTQYQLLCHIKSHNFVCEIETTQPIDKIQQFLLFITESMRSGLPLCIEANTLTEAQAEVYLHQIQFFDFNIAPIK